MPPIETVTLSLSDVKTIFDLWNARAKEGEWSLEDCADDPSEAQAEFFFLTAKELAE